MVNGELDKTTYFDEAELLAIFKQLIEKKSDFPNDTEEDVAKYVQHILQENGIEAKLDWVADGRPNVLAEIKGKKPGKTLLYNGHLDVVPATEDWATNPYEAVQRNGKIYGRGTSDMKSGVAAMIYAAIVLKRMGSPFVGTLKLFFNVDEERENAGMRHFLQSDVTAHYAVISEPTELAVHIAHKGIARFRVRTFGEAKHAGKVTQNESNAISHMMELIVALEEKNEQLMEKRDDVLGHASLTVTKITGGTAINIVPDMCEIEIDRRLLSGETEEQVTSDIETIIQEVANREAFSYEIDPYLFIPATQIEREHPFVKELSSVVEHVLQSRAEIGVFEASCEAPFLSVYKQIPTIICGPGSLNEAHRVNESVEIAEVIDASKIFIRLARKLLQ